jgi:glycosyltransferase involved in cell wall biosynthesis
VKVRYCGPSLDFSGYGEACRHDIAALNSAGVELTLEIPRHTLEIADFGDLGELCIGLQDKPLDCNISILHTTPNIYQKFIRPGDYNIGRVFWETDKLPPDFAYGVSMVDEVWTGSEYCAQAIRNAGIDKPTFIIPEAIKIPEKVKPFKTATIGDYCFYSIFEWTERKNPTALLEAFWREFEGVEDVALILKCYVDNFTPEKRRDIRGRFSSIKKKLKLETYAPVYLYTELMNRNEIYRLHKSFDCYVSAHRGEGWGIPQMEAMAMSNPIISTNCGGIHEHIEGVAKLIPWEPVQVSNDRNAFWYLPDQNWAEVDLDDLRRAMRWCYGNQEKAKDMGKRAEELVRSKFSFEVVGKQMAKRLSEITT